MGRYEKAVKIAKRNAPIVRDAYKANVSKSDQQKHAQKYAHYKAKVDRVRQDAKSIQAASRGPEPRPMAPPPSSSSRSTSTPSRKKQAIYGVAGGAAGVGEARTKQRSRKTALYGVAGRYM